MQRQHARQARGKQPRERIRRLPGDEQPAPRQNAEQEQHANTANEPELLADDGEDRVSVGVRHPVVLLQAIAQSVAEHAT